MLVFLISLQAGSSHMIMILPCPFAGHGRTRLVQDGRASCNVRREFEKVPGSIFLPVSQVTSPAAHSVPL